MGSVNHTFYQNFKKLIQDAFENGTLHGLASISRSKALAVKIIWSLIFLTSCGYCVFSICNLMTSYFSYPVISNIHLYYEKTPEFPAITICNTEQNTTMKIEDMIKNASFSKCQLGLIDFYSTKTYSYNPDFLTCFTFNFGKYPNGTKKEIRTLLNTNYGLELDIFTGHFSYASGLYLSIHNPTGYPSNERGFISIPAGMETQIMISKRQVKQTPKPYSDCQPVILKNIKFELYLDGKEIAYSHEYCLDMCFYHIESERCPDNRVKCLSNYHTIMENECIPQCPIQCENTYYDYSSSYLKLNRYYFDQLQEFHNYDLKESAVKLNIRLKDKKYTVIESTPKISVQDLIGQIGGTLGYFIGASLLSLVEIGELLIELILLIPKSIISKKHVHG